MKTITQEELKEILEKHSKFIRKEEGGERANLREANLSGLNFWCACLSDSDLFRANFRGANLYLAYLSDSDLREANLSRANLFGADLRYANFSGADLSGANLFGADLRYANFSGADLSGANLREADLCIIKRRLYIMDKKQQIEEIAKIINELYCVYTTTETDIAEGIYQSGYRKIDENCAVITKAELNEYKRQAVKEFAEKLKSGLVNCTGCYISNCFESTTDEFAFSEKDLLNLIDKLLKE